MPQLQIPDDKNELAQECAFIRSCIDDLLHVHSRIRALFDQSDHLQIVLNDLNSALNMRLAKLKQIAPEFFEKDAE